MSSNAMLRAKETVEREAWLAGGVAVAAIIACGVIWVAEVPDGQQPKYELLAAIAVPFLAFFFATFRAFQTTFRIVELNANDRSEKALNAVATEIQVNVEAMDGRLRELANVAASPGSPDKVKIQAHKFLIRTPLMNELYEAAAPEIGSTAPATSHALISCYADIRTLREYMRAKHEAATVDPKRPTVDYPTKRVGEFLIFLKEALESLEEHLKVLKAQARFAKNQSIAKAFEDVHRLRQEFDNVSIHVASARGS